VARPELGVKRTCPACRTRFYDMRRQPPACPQCGAILAVSETETGAGMVALRAGTAAACRAQLEHGVSNEDLAELATDTGPDTMGLEDVGGEYETRETDEEGNSYLEDFSELDGSDALDEVSVDEL